MTTLEPDGPVMLKPNKPLVKPNAAWVEMTVGVGTGFGTIVSTHPPGLDDTDPCPAITPTSSRLPESPTLPESFSVWIPLAIVPEGEKPITEKFQETMAPDESVPKVLFITYGNPNPPPNVDPTTFCGPTPSVKL